MKLNLFFLNGNYVLAPTPILSGITTYGEQFCVSPIETSDEIVNNNRFTALKGELQTLIYVYNMCKSANIPWSYKDLKELGITEYHKKMQPDDYNFVYENMTNEGQRKKHPFSRYTDRATLCMSEYTKS